MRSTQRHGSAFAHGVLDAVSAHIAVIDHRGRIVAVNEAWNRFAAANGGSPGDALGVGTNYLAVCRAAELGGDGSVRDIRLGIERVMAGDQDLFSCEYACHSPQTQRWFAMHASRVVQTGDVVIAHEDITQRRLAEDRLRASHDELEQRVQQRTEELEQRNARLREEIAERERAQQQLRLAAKVFDSAIEGIFVADAERRIVTVNAAFTRITGYSAKEAAGMNPRLLSSGRHEQAFYAAVWQSLDECGHWQGEIWNRRKNGEVFPAWESISVSKDARGRIVDYVAVFSDISAAKQAEARLAHLAHHDPLTGLANRLLFSDRLEQALERARRHGAMLALLYVDMDNFKFINDSLGHLAGDLYLQRIAERLNGLVRAEDTVARLGGDEFAILAEDIATAQDADRLGDKVVHALGQSVCLGEREIGSSASIGISLYPGDGTTGEVLLKAADSAMYQAKAEGRNTVRFFKPELSTQAIERMSLETGLRQALARRELRLHYQPLFDLHTMRCVGLEALLRWQWADRGLVMPESFIALAEQTRLIEPIGQWVLDQALQDMAAWRAQGLPPVRMSVNVSWRQFNDAHFAHRLGQSLQTFGLDGGAVALDLEITESALQDSKRAIDDLHQLRQRGVRILIDDFGTGYSSLGQLMAMPVDGLKIDRTFLRDVDIDRHARAIVRAVIALAQGLGVELVGEGVETAAQLAFLQAEGCRLAQGFLLGRPVAAAQVPRLFSPAAPVELPTLSP